MSFEFCWKWKSTHRHNFSNLHDEHNLCRHTITWVIFARGIKAEVRAQRERMEIRQCLLAQVLVNLVLPIPHPLRRALRKRIVHVTKGTKGQPVQISRAANHVLLVFTKQLLQMDLSVPRV